MTRSTSRKWGIALAGGLIVAGAVYLATRQVAPRSVLHPDGPEGRAASTFVGVETCRECHAENAESHLQTGHAATFALTKDSATARSLCGVTADGGKGYGVFHYACDDEGLMVELPGAFGKDRFPLDLAIGSGTNAVTFLTLIPNRARETVGIEHRMTWYRSDERLDVTPGQQDLSPGQEVEHFGRVFYDDDMRRCIDCHTTNYRLQGTQITDLIAGVHCESCHGAGSEHVALARSGRNDDALGRIRASWSADGEIRMCGECHRLPQDIESDRLDRYPPSLVRFQPVGLLRSRCYLESNGALRCTTCHNPHVPVHSVLPAEHEQRCLDCHRALPQVTCSVSPAAGCIDCHMPAIDLVRGIRFHDHWIRVRDKAADSSSPAKDARDAGHAVNP